MYNLKSIKEDLSCVDAAESLGIKIQKRGNNISMLCPAHNDKHFGSCFCYDAKWKCYACGAGGDVFSLIHEATGYTNSELFEEAAKLTGHPEKYKMGTQEENRYNEKKLEFPLSSDELELLELEKNFLIPDVKNIGFFNEETKYKRIQYSEQEFYEYGNYLSFSIIDLYQEDPEGMKFIFCNLAEEKEQKIEALLKYDFSAFPMSPETTYLVRNELKKNLVKLKTIKRKLA